VIELPLTPPRKPHTIPSMCVPVQALLGALVLRVEAGAEPTPDEIATLIAAGCTEEEVRRALDRAREKRASAPPA
jgi:hypothetical protein